jgi:uncharacterized membrane protein YbjE (DUF340 family)
MSHILSLLILIAFLFAGLLAGRIKAVSSSKIALYLLDLSLYFLLFFMGFRLGRNEEVARKLQEIGILSVAFTAATAAGTVGVLLAVYGLAARGKAGRKERQHTGAEPPAAGTQNAGAVSPAAGTQHAGDQPGGQYPDRGGRLEHVKEPAKLFGFVVLGFVIGRFVPVLASLTGEKLTTWFVYILLFLVGIQLNKNTGSLKATLLHPETLILPAGTVVGSLAGGAVVALIFGIPIFRGMAVAAGFGWYSLSGVIISDLGDQVLGSAAFLSNILRESVALLTIPLFGTTRFPRIGIGIAGATSMDVCLPLIQKSCGTRWVPLSVTNGAILSLLVPVLVPLFYHLG